MDMIRWRPLLREPNGLNARDQTYLICTYLDISCYLVLQYYFTIALLYMTRAYITFATPAHIPAGRGQPEYFTKLI